MRKGDFLRYDKHGAWLLLLALAGQGNDRAASDLRAHPTGFWTGVSADVEPAVPQAFKLSMLSTS